MTLSARETSSTRQSIIDAARNVLMSDGYSGLSTRAVAVAANTQMSQIRYHFRRICMPYVKQDLLQQPYLLSIIRPTLTDAPPTRKFKYGPRFVG